MVEAVNYYSIVKRYLFAVVVILAVSVCPGQACRAESEPAGPIRFGLHATGGAVSLITGSEARVVRAIVQWDQLQPAPGRINFARLDRYMTAAGRYGVDVTLTIRCNSRWACTMAQPRPRREYDYKSSMPRDISAWRHLISAIVERYDGDGINDMPGLATRLRAVQLDNEFIPQWGGTADELVLLMKETYTAAKSACPDIIVVSPGYTGCLPFAVAEGLDKRAGVLIGQGTSAAVVPRQQVLRLLSDNPKYRRSYDLARKFMTGGHPWFDVVDVHIYATELSDVTAAIDWIRHQLSLNGAQKRIWSLEFGLPFHSFTQQDFRRKIVTGQVTGFASGLERIYWSSLIPTRGWGEEYLRLALATEDRRPKPAYFTYSATARALGDFGSLERQPAPAGVSVYRFLDASGNPMAWIVWSDADRRVVVINTGLRGEHKLSRPSIDPGSAAVEVIVGPDISVKASPDPCLIIPPQRT